MLRALGTELMKRTTARKNVDLQVLQMFCSDGATCQSLNLIALERTRGDGKGGSCRYSDHLLSPQGLSVEDPEVHDHLA
jgi:hypothetical protein